MSELGGAEIQTAGAQPGHTNEDTEGVEFKRVLFGHRKNLPAFKKKKKKIHFNFLLASAGSNLKIHKPLYKLGHVWRD